MKMIATARLALLGAAFAMGSTAANAQHTAAHYVGGSYAGAHSVESCYEGLCMQVIVRRINVNGNRSEVCVWFTNPSGNDWSGGFRLSDRNDRTTHRTISVPGNDSAEYCEIVASTSGYFVTLRQY